MQLARISMQLRCLPWRYYFPLDIIKNVVGDNSCDNIINTTNVNNEAA